MSAITTHVLDTSRGRPAAASRSNCIEKSGEDWKSIGDGVTDANGRCNTLMGEGQAVGRERTACFSMRALTIRRSIRKLFIRKFRSFLKCATPKTHYHVPLLISPFGYSTYRGS